LTGTLNAFKWKLLNELGVEFAIGEAGIIDEAKTAIIVRVAD